MAAPFPEHNYFAACAFGLEPLLADELRSMRCRGVRPQRGGVLFRGTFKDGYRVCLWSRLASRVLLTLETVDASNADTLHEGVLALPWEDFLRANGTFKVNTTGVNKELRNTQFTNMRVKDGVADRFLARFDRRPSIETVNPDLIIDVHISGDHAKIALDLAGEPLHRRGYRQEGKQVVAPMKETLAAAMLIVAGWPQAALEKRPFVDFLCGSGTIALEAALIACDYAPGLLRGSRGSDRAFGFQRWTTFDSQAWEALLDEAEKRRDAGMADAPAIAASDHDARGIELARRSIRRAGLERVIRLERLEMEAATPAALGQASCASKGLVALNPPYGERLAQSDELPTFYRSVAAHLRADFAAWQVAIISPDPRLSWALELEPEKTYDLYNGRILAPVRVYRVGPPQEVAAPSTHDAVEKRHEKAFEGHGIKALDVQLGIDDEALRNRLSKMKKHREKWARKAGINAYRLYDADLPDYNCAIDVYQGAGPSEGRLWVHIAEYAAPHEVSEMAARARLTKVEAACKELFAPAETGDPEPTVVVKQRKRQRGADQYERAGGATGLAFVEEAGLRYELNMTEYLDTGLFLDHRDVRAYVRAQSANKHVLNLFAYTGAVSAVSAAGGASSVTTVDLSNTYLEVAKRNLERNGLLNKTTIFEQADVLAWITQATEQDKTFDLIFCDPPTFSNSKRMEGTWDVQRDYLALLVSLKPLMAPGATLIFSNNKRGFVMDAAALEAQGFRVKDITKRTLPQDFEGKRLPHVVYELTCDQ